MEENTEDALCSTGCGRKSTGDHKGIEYCDECLLSILEMDEPIKEKMNRLIDDMSDKSVLALFHKIKHLLPSYKNTVTAESIRIAVCSELGVDPKSIDVKTRKREIVFARQLCMIIAKCHTKMSLAQIGFEYGNKNHATTLHAVKTIRSLYETDKTVRDQISPLFVEFELLESFIKL